MTTFRRSRIITLIFSATWLLISLSYSFGAECLCCNHSEPKNRCCEKTHAVKCCLDLKHFSQDCQCQCISCGKLAPNDLLRRKEYINTFNSNQILTLEQVSSDSHIPVNEQNIAYYQYNSFPLKYPSLFLINSSFLL